MRRWPSSTFCCGLAVWSVIGVLLHYGLAAPQTAENNISFLWAFIARTGAGDTKPVAITQDTARHTGDQFKMIVQLQTPCFVYVLHSSKNKEGAESDVTWLFPYNKPQFATDYLTFRVNENRFLRIMSRARERSPVAPPSVRGCALVRPSTGSDERDVCRRS